MHQLLPLMTVQEAADYLRLSAGKLNRLRVCGGGPVYVKAGARIVYRREALDSWAVANERSDTGNARAAEVR